MITVDLLDHMGSDLTVVNAARVSFDKVAKWKLTEDGLYPTHAGDKFELEDRDAKLINYLATHEHWSPFAHPQVSFRVSAPIFVARQLQKHTVGLAWNEVSRRYVDSEPTFYQPETWRKRAENVKQGSSEEAVELNYSQFRMFWPDTAVGAALGCYQKLLEAGVCPEQARMVLPQSMMTEWHWTGSLYAFARVCKLRLDAHTQRETQEVAKQIAKHMAGLFPVSWAALVPGCQD